MTKFPTPLLGKNLCNFEDFPLAKNTWEGCWMRVSIGKEEDMRRVVEAFSRMCAESFEEGGTTAECVPA